MNRQKKGAIAAGHKLTAEAGADMLREGGSAIDAAIAALAVACVCEPVLASPGGGGFAMLRDGESGETTLIDFFPQTPQVRRGNSTNGFRHIQADFGATTQVFHIGPATVAAPGFFAGLSALHGKGATFSFADLYAPAIRIAEQGHNITAYQHYLSTVVRPILTATKAARDLFAPGGELSQAGDVFRNPELAGMFREASHGDWVKTSIADQLLSEQAREGHLIRDDLDSYQVVERQPVFVSINGSKVHLNPLPAASGTLIRYALAQLERCETLDLAKALQETDAARLSAQSDLSVLLDRPMRQQGTTHISTIDADGNACAVTVSNGTGSGEMVGGYGFMLNNILGEEDVNPNGSFDWPVNTRLASMMCPTLIDTPDGRLIALGSGGSSRIRSAIFQSVARLCLESTNLHQAIDATRLHVEDGHLDIETILPGQEMSQLAVTFPDHKIWSDKNMYFGGVHAVRVDADCQFDGVGDQRREGVAIVVD